MIARLLGALATLVATTAHAERAPTPAVLGVSKDQSQRTEQPRPKPHATKPRATNDDLLELTNDPLVGRADRIRGEDVKGMVTFTFDDGPHPDTTPAVLDALVKYDVPATFFIVTRRLLKHGEKGRAILQRTLESGFLVASHSVSHRNLRRASPETLAAEIDQSVRTLAKAANRPIGLFRAPFGAIDARGRGWLKKRGLTEAFWSIDTRDWQAKDADRLRSSIFKMIVDQQGGVVLLHDVKQITAEIIASVLDDLEAENCKRLAQHRDLILPVSIHYFLRDKKKPRDIPDDVKQTTAAYRHALPARCAARPPELVPEILKPVLWE